MRDENLGPVCPDTVRLIRCVSWVDILVSGVFLLHVPWDTGRHSMKSITLIMISFCTTCSSGVSQEDYDRVVAE